MRTKRERHQGLGEHHRIMRNDSKLLIIECLANHHAFGSSNGLSYRKLAAETEMSVITVKKVVRDMWLNGFLSKRKIVRTTKKMHNMGSVTNHKMTSVFFNFFNTELSTLKTIQYEEECNGKWGLQCIPLMWDVLGKDHTEAELHYLLEQSTHKLNDNEKLALDNVLHKHLFG